MKTSSTPTSITSIGRTVRRMVLISLAMLVSGCRETIVHNVEESTANRIALVLAQAAIQSEKVQEGALWNIVVSDDNATDALATIEEQRVLKPSLVGALSASGGGLIQTREERMRGIERERASTLEATLERLPGVLEARVHLIFAPEDTVDFSPKRKRDSASVLIIRSATETVNEEQVKRLVSGGAGIDGAAISVVITEQSKQFPVVKPELRPATNSSGAPTNKTNTITLLSSNPITAVSAGALSGFGIFGIFLYRGRKRGHTNSRSDESLSPAEPELPSELPLEEAF